MRIVPNTGTDRVVDIVRPWLQPGHRVDLASQTLSLFAFAELADEPACLAGAGLVLPSESAELHLLGSTADRAARNRLQSRWLAGRCAAWNCAGPGDPGLLQVPITPHVQKGL